jgi:flagellar biosynthesis protein FlhF
VPVHTFISDSASEAVERIRAELGPAAVVLSVRKLPASGFSRIWSSGQIEVTAGVPDEVAIPPEAPIDSLNQLRDEIRELKARVAQGELSSKSGDNAVQPAGLPADGGVGGADMSGWGIGRVLAQTGVLPIYAEQIAEDLAARYPAAAGDMTRQIELAKQALRTRWRRSRGGTNNFHIFIGPAGSGKSTALCKWLAQSILVANEPGAVFQLDTRAANSSSLPALYSEILGAVYDRVLPADVDDFSGNGFIDLPGVTRGSEQGLADTAKVIEQVPGATVHLVLNAAYESSLLLEQARFFSSLPVHDMILTHLDEESRWGKFWNLLFGTNLPLRFFSAGQNIPGDFTSATPEHLFARQFSGK